LLYSIIFRSSHQEKLKNLARQVHSLTFQALAAINSKIDAESSYARSEYAKLPVAKIRMHYVIAGPESGPLVFLLHGFPECWYTWRNQISALANAGYRVVCPDMPGYNLSDKPKTRSFYTTANLAACVDELIGALGGERLAALVGHDWGGVVSMAFAKKFPERLEKLAVLNAPLPEAIPKYMRTNPIQILKSGYIFFFQIPYLSEALLTADPMRMVKSIGSTAVEKKAFDQFDYQVLACSLSQPGASTAMLNYYRANLFPPQTIQKLTKRISGLFSSSSSSSSPPRRSGPRPAINVPSLVIWGMEDKALEFGLTKYMNEQSMPKLQQIVRVPRCGHWITGEAPEEVNYHLTQFLGKRL